MMRFVDAFRESIHFTFLLLQIIHKQVRIKEGNEEECYFISVDVLINLREKIPQTLSPIIFLIAIQ